MSDAEHKQKAEEPTSEVFALPRTKLGMTGGVMALLFLFLFAPKILASIPFGAVVVFSMGIAAGIVCLLAMLIHAERSWMNWLGLLVGVIGVVALIVVFLILR